MSARGPFRSNRALVFEVRLLEYREGMRAMMNVADMNVSEMNDKGRHPDESVPDESVPDAAVPDAAVLDGSVEEPSVNAEHLAAAITAVAALDIRQKEEVCDRVHVTQPNLLASVLALPRLGVSVETVDVIVHILMTLHLAVEHSGQILATVSEEDQERQLRNLAAAVRLAECSGHEGQDEQAFLQTPAYRKESMLLAYVLGRLQSSGIVDQREEHAKYAMLAAINLVNCIAMARRMG